MSISGVMAAKSGDWGISPRTGTSGIVNPSDIQYEDGVSTIRVTMASRKAAFEPVAIKTDIPGSLSRNSGRTTTATSSSVSVSTAPIPEENGSPKDTDDASESDNECISTLSDSQLAGNIEMVQTLEDSTIPDPASTRMKSNSVTVRSSGSVNTTELFDSVKRNVQKSKRLSDSSSVVIGPTLVDNNDTIIPTLPPVPIGPAAIGPSTIVPASKNPTIPEHKANGSVLSGDKLSSSNNTLANGSAISNSTQNLRSNLKATPASDPCVFTTNKSADVTNNNASAKDNKNVSWDEAITVSDGVTADVITDGLQKEDHEYSPQSHDDLRPPDDYYGSALDADSYAIIHKRLTSQRMCMCILTFLAILLLLAVITLAFILSWKYIVDSNDASKIRDALHMDDSTQGSPFNNQIWHTPLNGSDATVFYLMEDENEMIRQRPSGDAYLYWHKGRSIKVTMKVQGVTSDVILGDPLSRSGAVYFTNLAAEQIYSAIIDADGSEATLISIAPKSDTSLTWSMEP